MVSPCLSTIIKTFNVTLRCLQDEMVLSTVSHLMLIGTSRVSPCTFNRQHDSQHNLEMPLDEMVLSTIFASHVVFCTLQGVNL
jgi:hypothetical protein